MIALKTILAPTDFSHHAEIGLRYAAGLAERYGEVLHVLHVLPEIVAPVGPEPMLLPTVPQEFYAEAEEEAKKVLGGVLKPEWGAPAEVVRSVRWGDTVSAIVTYAREVGSELIVVATHGRSGLSHVLLGSVAERIVREAPCPVLTVRDVKKG